MKLKLVAAILAVAAAALPLFANGEAYPARPVRIVVPAPAGGASDFVIRPVAAALAKQFKQPFVVENRPGATGMIGMKAVSGASPDGYTLVFGTISNFVTNVAVNPSIGYDPLKDFAAVSVFFRAPFLVSVPAGSAINNVGELVAAAKSNPGKMTYASAGVGSFGHLLTEHFSTAAKVGLTHVPFQGSAPAIANLVSGHVDVFFDSIQSSSPFVNGGKIRSLAIGAPARSAQLPGVPTFAELGYTEVDGAAWWGLFAPARTPPEVLATLHRGIETALADPTLRGLLTSTGGTVDATSPADSMRTVAAGLDLYRALARSLKITVE